MKSDEFIQHSRCQVNTGDFAVSSMFYHPDPVYIFESFHLSLLRFGRRFIFGTHATRPNAASSNSPTFLFFQCEENICMENNRDVHHGG